MAKNKIIAQSALRPIIPHGGYAVYGWTWAYHNGEMRIFTSGWFMLATAQVEKALMEKIIMK